MYMPGRLRTASSPSSAVMLFASYAVCCCGTSLERSAGVVLVGSVMEILGGASWESARGAAVERASGRLLGPWRGLIARGAEDVSPASHEQAGSRFANRPLQAE